MRFAVLSAFLLSASVASAQDLVEPSRGRVQVYLGQRSLDEDVWAPLEDQVALGVEYVSAPIRDGFLSWELGSQFSIDSDDVMDVDVTSTVLELYLGGRATLGRERVRPYLGGGVGYLIAELEGESGGITVSDDDSSVGFYGHGGVDVRLNDRLTLGLDVRAMAGTDLELFGADGDVDYTQVALTFGWDA